MLDITGAFFLAMSFVLKKQRQMLKESQSYMDGNPYLLPSAVRQTLEARTGFGFLFLGFMGQFVAYTNWVRAGSDNYPLWVLLGGAVLFAVAFGVVRISGEKWARCDDRGRCPWADGIQGPPMK
jgi:hypothetical protein